MAREAKFNFVAESQLTDMARVKKAESHCVTINAKHGYMRLSLQYVRDNQLDGTFVKLHADTSKKAIGWKILREKSLRDMNSYRPLKIYKSTNAKGHTFEHCQLSIHKLLKLLEVEPVKSYIGLPVKRYNMGLLEGEIHYVELQ